MAATNNYKCTWVFAMGRDGWEETWYKQAQSPAAALQSMNNVTAARLDLCNPNVNIDQLKVSDEAILGDSLPAYNWNGQVSPLTKGTTRGVKTQSLLCRAFSAQAAGPGAQPFQYQRAVELSGLPSSWVNYTPAGAPIIPPGEGGQLSKSFAAWVNKMLAEQFCLRVIDKSQPLKAIRAIYTNPNTVAQPQSAGKILIHCPGHGIVPTDVNNKASTYRIKGAKFLPTATDPRGLGPLDSRGHSIINRIQQYQDITQAGTPLAYPVVNGIQVTPQDFLQLSWDLPGSFGLLVYVGGGAVQARLITYPQLATIPGPTPNSVIGPIIAERFNSRDRGRARFVQRGRSPKRVLSAGIR